MTSPESVRQEALARVRSGDYTSAIDLYDQALSLSPEEELRELITINKAHAMISAKVDGSEVRDLQLILLRRKSVHHAFLAAYALILKYRLCGDVERALFYAQLAVDMSRDHDHPSCQIAALNELGILYECESHFEPAIACYAEAVERSRSIEDHDERTFLQTALVANLGYNNIIIGKPTEGVALLESVIDEIALKSDRCDAHVDLCYGYLDLDELEAARRHGEAALDLAVEPRQIRNVHLLLGETAQRAGDASLAQRHFDRLAELYPHFRHLKDLLLAVDLRRAVNLML